MKLYLSETKFDFGKYKDKTLIEVAMVDPSYIEWCIINLKLFFTTELVIEKFRKLNPNFSISEDAILWLHDKDAEFIDRMNHAGFYRDNESKNYEKYNGSYAQSGEGLSDEFIDNTLDGDPEAYWNID